MGYCNPRDQWMQLLTDRIQESTGKAAEEECHIGIIGALGAHDVGDEAMLRSLMGEIAGRMPGAVFTVFSNRPEVTDAYLATQSAPTLHRWLYNRRSLLSWVLNGADALEAALTRLAGAVFQLDPIMCDEWLLRGVLALLDKRLDRLTRDSACGRLRGDASLLSEHVRRVAACDVVLLLGGGYLNSWHVKARAYITLATAQIALRLGKPVFASGLNLGPFNRYDLRAVGRILGQFELIGLRDRDESPEALRQMGIWDPAIHHFSSDDAIMLGASTLGQPELEGLTAELGSYVAFQMHRWLLSTKDLHSLSAAMAEALDQVVERHDVHVLMVPMTFGEVGSRDLAVMKGVQATARHADRFHAAATTLQPEQLKYLFSRAQCAVVTRHHALVFAVSSGVPCVAVELDPYYRMKLAGMAGEYEGLCSILPMSVLEPASIVKAVSGYLTGNCAKSGDVNE
jgi:polysaccharide pyruvyl transferase WcaK-like protein